MKKIAFFDCFAGISGDMLLGALVDAGLELKTLSAQLKKIPISGYHLEATPARKNGITGTKVNVILDEDDHVHRHLADIQNIIEKSQLSSKIKEKGLAIFQRLAGVEAGIHGASIDKVHFHEVGAIDAIVDIMGALIGIESLGIEKIYSSPVRLGTGTTKSMHGTIPVPAPATVGLLKNFPVIQTQVFSELTTPTGAVLISTLAEPITQPIEMVIEKIGYGAGFRDLKEIPNMLRVFLGQKESLAENDEVWIIETNIDDMNPEFYPFVIDKLLQVGAMDAFLTPIIMKKGRPATMISVLADHRCLKNVIDILYRETSTLGLRIYKANRQKLPRTTETVETVFGKVEVKVATWNDKKRYIPEFEICKKISEAKGIPLKEVYASISKLV